jgi:para-nitrobenzyl esterase
MHGRPISVDGGKVQGVASADGLISVFRGIPFAAPPVGDLRWRPPQPVTPWDGVRLADRFGSVPIQPLLPRNALMRQFSFGEPPESGMSEDCLYLNVWTPAQGGDERLPVMVWVFGGGHRVGGGSHPPSWGEGLARKGAVVVTLNYRVGALGYIAHPALTAEAGASGNYASMDILAALTWVQRNIAGFGGDPDCVTLFGQSAGAMHINALMTARGAKGLFHRAIAQSGGRLHGGQMGPPMKSLAEAEADGAALLAGLGAHTLEELRDLPADVMAAPRGMWDLIIDGAVLDEDIQTVFERGGQAHVPLIAGFNADEGAAYPEHDIETAEAVEAMARARFGDQAKAFLDLYPTRSDADAKALKHRLPRDASFGFQAFKLAELQSRVRTARTFAYYFDRAAPLPAGQRFREPVPPGGYGAFHGCEIWYVFDTLRTRPNPGTEEDQALADAIGRYWVNFARSGDPNGRGLPRWPVYASPQRQALRLGDAIHADRFPNESALAFFDAFYRQSFSDRTAPPLRKGRGNS